MYNQGPNPSSKCMPLCLMRESPTATVKFRPPRALHFPRAWQMMEHAADIKISVSGALLSIIAVSLLLLAPPLFLDTHKSLFQNAYNYDVTNREEKNGSTVFL